MDNPKATIELFSRPMCPHCPNAEKEVKKFIEGRDDVKLELLSTATSEGARRGQVYGIMSVPTIIIKGPGTTEPIGLRGVPSRDGFDKAVSIALGKANWEEKKGLWDWMKELIGL